MTYKELEQQGLLNSRIVNDAALKISKHESNDDYNKYGDHINDYGQLTSDGTGYAASRGVGQWANFYPRKSQSEKLRLKPLAKNEIPSTFKEHASTLGLDPNDFSEENQDKVLLGMMAKRYNENGGNIRNAISQWNPGAGEEYVNKVLGQQIDKETTPSDSNSYDDDIDSWASNNITTNDQHSNKTDDTSDIDNYANTKTETAPKAWYDEATDFGKNVLGSFIQPVESLGHTLLGTSGAAGEYLAHLAKNDPESFKQALQNQLQNVDRTQLNLTGKITGKDATGRDITTGQGVKQTSGDVLMALLNAGLGLGNIGGNIGKDVISRGAILPMLKTGAKYGAGTGLAQQLQDGGDVLSTDTANKILGSALTNAALLGVPAGFSKGSQILSEKIAGKLGNEAASIGNKIKREIGINPLLNTPESQKALEEYRIKDLDKTRESLTELIKNNSTARKLIDTTNRLKDVPDESIHLIQKIFAENPVKFESDGKIQISDAHNYANKLLDKTAGVINDTVSSLHDSGIKINTDGLRAILDKNKTQGVPGLARDKADEAFEMAKKLLNNKSYSKNGVLDFKGLNALREAGNTVHDSNARASEVEAYKQVANAVRELFDHPTFKEHLTPEQTKVFNTYQSALKTFGNVSDAQRIITDISDSKLKGSKWLNRAGGAVSVLGAHNPLAFPIGSELMDKLQKVNNKSKIASTVYSKLPNSVLKDTVGNLEKEASKHAEELKNAIKAKMKLPTIKF